MDNQILTISAKSSVSRIIYVKTALIILAVAAFIHLSGQLRNPPLIDYRISLVICLSLGGLGLYGLTRTPYTRSLRINERSQKIIIEYLTLTKSFNKLEIPLKQFTLEIDDSFSVRSYGAKWKAYLLLDGQKSYSLRNDETGFSEADMNKFIGKLSSYQEIKTESCDNKSLDRNVQSQTSNAE